MNLRLSTTAVTLLAIALLAGSSRAAESERPLNFVNDVMPVFTKAGCNAGACHAKASNGQNGFRLSLLGFEPQEDYEHIVKEAHGRRIFPASPEQSLLLLKVSNTVPHGGGRRLEPGSDGYELLRQWIAEGMPYAGEADPTLDSIEVQPAHSTLQSKSQQQLTVLAHYSDGSSRDVTHIALYEPNDKSMAEADEAGLVKILDIPGNVAVMVRYQGLVSVYSASIPLGAKVDNLPAEKNFIDQLVFANLTQIGVPPSPLCDDGTFLRRATLDIAGRLPTVEETRSFLSGSDPNKRDRLIDTLLATSDYADYFANKWAALLKNKRDRAGDKTSNFAFHFWLRDSLLANKPFDQIVRELLGATGQRRRESAGRLVQAGEGTRSTARRRRATVSRGPHALRTVPSSSLRSLEPGAITTAFPRSSARSAAGRPTPMARMLFSTSVASPKQRTRRRNCP